MNAKIAAAATRRAQWTDLEIDGYSRILIEASAGTGKTWTIAALYLRIILERGLSPREIVVTTFTEAAAAELRERLRAILIHAEREGARMREDAPASSGYEAWLHARWLDDAAKRAGDLEKLRLALSQLDVAPIGTLHGLCRRILADHPFASGIEFVLPELVAGEAVLDEISKDVWRIVRQGVDDAAAATLSASGVTTRVEDLRKARSLLLAAGAQIAEPTEPGDIDGAAMWAAHLRNLVDAPKLIKKSTEGIKLSRGWLTLADWLEGKVPVPGGDFLDDLRQVASSDSFWKQRSGDDAVSLAIRFTLDRAIPALESVRLTGLHALSRIAHERLRATLARRNQMRFDDLLTHVRDALGREAHGTKRALADVLFKAWPVALIDEFQDTDAVQFGILDAIYRDDRGRPRGWLAMIGDPKQAIYRFRGGDIDAYRDAAAQADQHLTLDTNRRSSRALVAALNEFYAAGGSDLSAFVPAPIAYAEVAASDRRDSELYTIAGAPVRQPLAVHCREECADKIGARRTAALTQCANQIVQMLQSGDHEIAGRRITPADIAVLVPTGKHISELRELLRARRVPCVTSDRTSVFFTDVARELQIVLHAIANPGNLGALRAAAATRLWGASFADLQRFGDDLVQWQPIADRFHAWHGVWTDRGVMAVVEELLEHGAARFLKAASGERTLTDLRHLGELLQAEDDTVAGKEELLAWFMRQRSDASEDDAEAIDAAQLRIESDGDRVRVMTLHLSKGLEFPIVFLPLMWDHAQFAPAKLHVVHGSSGRQIAVSAAARERELRDLQDERFRVLYVALTRAIHACHVYALPESAAKKGTECSAFDAMIQRMDPPLAQLGEASVSVALKNATPHIEWVAGWLYRDAQLLHATTAGAPTAERKARELHSAQFAAYEAKHSFTTLTQFAHAGPETETPAADELDIDEWVAGSDDLDVASAAPEAGIPGSAAAAAEPHPQLARLARVRGADFGNAVHAIFERRIVGVPLSQQRDLVAQSLNEAGVRRRDIETDTLVTAIVDRLDGTLAAPLGLVESPQLRLGDVEMRNQRAEMEFHFAIDGVEMKRLREACSRHGEPDLVPRNHAVLSGLMTGKIDLIFQHAGRFHVLDYKGNYLGDRVADYRADALRVAMDSSHYRFQALIYTIATDRYLRLRLGSRYERGEHLGECVYFFLRAVGLADDAGLWRHRFDDALIAAVDAVLAGPRRVAA